VRPLALRHRLFFAGLALLSVVAVVWCSWTFIEAVWAVLTRAGWAIK
jgi:hypothetical protein